MMYTFIYGYAGVLQGGPEGAAQVVPLTVGGPQSLQLTWTPLPGPEYMWYYISNSYVTSVLYYNGQLGIPSGTFVSSIQQYGANGAYQNLTIDLVCAQDSGYLDANLMINTDNYLYYNFGGTNLYCPYDYYSFVNVILGITSIQLDSLPIHLTYDSSKLTCTIVSYILQIIFTVFLMLSQLIAQVLLMKQALTLLEVLWVE